jgi:two-component system phosphate regulon sensor histidine kinase PhoR
VQPTQYKRQTLALFFIVSLIPALVVAAIWYLETQISSGDSLIVNFKSFVLPVMVLGVLPALILSFVFAELLARPLRAIHAALYKLASGHYLSPEDLAMGGEFQGIGSALAKLSIVLERTISETKSQGDLVTAERNKLRGVLNSMTDGVFALDSAGRIILFNHAAATLTGRSIAEVAGQLAEKAIPLRQNGELVMTRWLATERGNEQKVGQWTGLELYRADGSSIYVNVQAVVLPADPNGIAALITFHDVSASQELEAMKIDFVALAAHELRTPITEVRGYLDILSHDLKRPTKDQRELLEHALASADQLRGLVNNLLSVSQIEHGEINHQPETLDYGKFVTELGTSLGARAKLAGRALKISVATDLPAISGDPIGLHEVISNLVENALVHTTTGPIELTLESDGKMVTTTVHDHGEGIAQSALPHLFTKFFRVNEMTTPTRGTGLGLYICQHIIEAHGGKITVESRPGEGSTFKFSLPISRLTAGDARNKLITRGAHGWIKNHTVR